MIGREARDQVSYELLPYIKADGFGGLGHGMKVMFFSSVQSQE